MKNDSGTKQSAGTKAGAVGLALGLGVVAVLLTGCRSDMAAVQQAPIVDGNAASDPANVNMAVAPVAGSQPVFDAAAAARNGYAPSYRYAPRTRVAGQSFSAQPESYGQDYPVQDGRQTRSEAYNYNTQSNQGYQDQAYQGQNYQGQNYQGQNYQGQGYSQSADGYGVDDDQLYSELLDTNVPIVQQPPPPLPQYEQPIAPGPNYLWTPGYWNYANAGYYYVPGNWVSAPFQGALWTPGWWGYTGRGYGFHRGYWGRHVGYYGGVNYGFGFIGIGYQGGYWNNDHFLYNRDCNHVDPRIVNDYVYQRNVTVTKNTYVNNTRISYNGGPGGLDRRPLPAEFAATREMHLPPLPAQVAERQAASQNRQQFFAANQGRPQQMFAAHPVLERNVNVPAQLAQPQRFNGPAAAQGNGLNRGQWNNPQQGVGTTSNARFNHGADQLHPDQPQVAAQQQQLANNQRQQRQQQEQVQRQQQFSMQGRQATEQVRATQQNQQARQQQDQQRSFQQRGVQQQDQQRMMQQQARQQQDQQRAVQNQQRAVQPQARPQQDRSLQQQFRPAAQQPQPPHAEGGHDRGR